MFSWWFSKIGIKEFIDIVIESLNMRHAEAGKLVRILDRGTLMFKAVCAATMSMRTGKVLADSIKQVDVMFSQGLSYDQKEENNILLMPNSEYQDSVMPYLALLQDNSESFTTTDNNFYRVYQDLLKEAVVAYFENNTAGRIIANDSICEIQNRLRRIIGKITGYSLSEIGDSVKQIVGFGGLSECGKSSFAEYLCKSKGYYRLKLGHFVEILKRRGEKESPENVAMEFLHFCKWHYYVKGFTLESLHEPYTPAYLKLLFGKRFQIIYLDASFDIRSQRASVEKRVSLLKAEKETRRKDRIKVNRGAEMVCGIADVKFDNSKGGHRENILKFEKLILS